MMQHLPAVIGYLVMEVLACVALYIRMSRHARPLGSIIMFILDASLGIFVLGDLTYLYLMGRARNYEERMVPVRAGGAAAANPSCTAVPENRSQGSSTGNLLRFVTFGWLLGVFK